MNVHPVKHALTICGGRKKVIVARLQGYVRVRPLVLFSPPPFPTLPSSLKRNDMHPDFLNGANQPAKQSFCAPNANMA